MDIDYLWKRVMAIFETNKMKRIQLYITILGTCSSLACVMLLINGYNMSNNDSKNVQIKEVDEKACITPHKDTLSIELVEEFLYNKRVEHPKIVLAQIRLESGNMDSFLFRENNNFLGMRYAAQRPTVACGKKNGYADYEHWEDCVYDYMVWQSRYAKKLSEDEYFAYLAENYAQDTNYVKKLKQIIDE